MGERGRGLGGGWIPQPLLSTPPTGVDVCKGWKVKWLWEWPSTRPRGSRSKVSNKTLSYWPCHWVVSLRVYPPPPMGVGVVSLPLRSSTTHAGPQAHLLKHLVQGLRPR